jgi:hypothetical protein
MLRGQGPRTRTYLFKHCALGAWAFPLPPAVEFQDRGTGARGFALPVLLFLFPWLLLLINDKTSKLAIPHHGAAATAAAASPFAYCAHTVILYCTVQCVLYMIYTACIGVGPRSIHAALRVGCRSWGLLVLLWAVL